MTMKPSTMITGTPMKANRYQRSPTRHSTIRRSKRRIPALPSVVAVMMTQTPLVPEGWQRHLADPMPHHLVYMAGGQDHPPRVSMETRRSTRRRRPSRRRRSAGDEQAEPSGPSGEQQTVRERRWSWRDSSLFAEYLFHALR